MALILCISNFYPQLFMASVHILDYWKLSEEYCHCFPWTYSSQSFEQSDSSTENKKSLPNQCFKVDIRPYNIIKKSFMSLWTCLSNFLFSSDNWELHYFNGYSYRRQWGSEISISCAT